MDLLKPFTSFGSGCKPAGRLLSIIAIAALLGAFLPAMAGDAPGLKITVEPVKEIYNSHEGLMMKFVFSAQSRTKVCLDKDLLSQMQMTISRSGSGKLGLQPLVTQDNSVIFCEPMQVRWLESGETLTLRANLKRYHFTNGEKWDPGEYSVGATFNLCEQNQDTEVTQSGHEIPIKSAKQGWFMIML